MQPLLNTKKLSVDSKKSQINIMRHITEIKNKIDEIFPQKHKITQNINDKNKDICKKPKLKQKSKKIYHAKEILNKKYPFQTNSLNTIPSKSNYKSHHSFNYRLPNLSSKHASKAIDSPQSERANNISTNQIQSAPQIINPQFIYRSKSEGNSYQQFCINSNISPRKKNGNNIAPLYSNDKNYRNCIYSNRHLSVQDLFTQIDMRSEILQINNENTVQNRNQTSIVSVKPIKLSENLQSLRKKYENCPILKLNKLKKLKTKKSHLFPYSQDNVQRNKKSSNSYIEIDKGSNFRKIQRISFDIKGWSSSNLDNQDLRKQQQTEEMEQKIQTQRSLRRSNQRASDQVSSRLREKREQKQGQNLTIQQLELAILS